MSTRTRKICDLLSEQDGEIERLEAKVHEQDAEIKKLKRKLEMFAFDQIEQGSMQTPLSCVPIYLHKSEHYLNLTKDNSGDNESLSESNSYNADINPCDVLVTVPRNCLKRNTDIQNLSDLQNLLSTIKFWVLRPFPASLFEFAMNPETSSVFRFVVKELLEDSRDWPEIEQLSSIAYYSDTGDRLVAAMEIGAADEILQYLLDSCNANVDDINSIEPTNEEFSLWPARLSQPWWGSRYELSSGKARDDSDDDGFSNPTEGKYLGVYHDSHGPWGHRRRSSRDVDTTGNAAYAAAEYGKLNVLKFILECDRNQRKYIKEEKTQRDDCCRPSIINCAVSNGHYECMVYLHKQGFSLYKRDAAESAIIRGYLDCLQYVHANGYILDESCTHLAAVYHQLECLKYVHTHGFKMNEDVLANILFHGTMECLEYYHEQRCPWPSSLPPICMEFKRSEFLIFMVDHGCPVDENTMSAAVRHGNYKALKYLRDKGCSWDSSVSYAAISADELQCLKYLHENGCPIDEDALKTVPVHRKCGRYLIEQGFGLLVADDEDYDWFDEDEEEEEHAEEEKEEEEEEDDD